MMASEQQMLKFHDPDYIKYMRNYIEPSLRPLEDLDFPDLKKISSKFNIFNPDNKESYRLNNNSDCPGFLGVYSFSQLSVGGSVSAAHLITSNQADLAINFSGGLHHAKKAEASGFCYLNDIVLCILELLPYYQRVLYVDIDVHHGDGVEEAFYLTNRVMTLSFHEYGDDFFPGSGCLDSFGDGPGKYYAINVPLKPGMNDECFEQLFKTITQRVMETYRPEVMIMQLGTDSLAYDKLGHYNVSSRGHGSAVAYMLTFGVPIIFVGGGGYTVQNVARCWAREVGLMLNMELDEYVPNTDPFYEWYGPDHKLIVASKNNVENKNTNEQLKKLQEKILQRLKEIENAPSVQFHYVPTKEDSEEESEESEEEYGPKKNVRLNEEQKEKFERLAKYD